LYNHAVIIKGFLKWCVDRDLPATNPLRGCKFSKPPRKSQMAPTLDQVNQILDKAPEPLKTYLAVLALTGMRLGELQHLRPEDLDLAGNWIHIVPRQDWQPKNRTARKIPIHPRLRLFLEALPKAKGPYLFGAQRSGKSSQPARPIDGKQLNRSAQRVARRCGIPTGRKNGGFVAHSLRHFFKTFCHNANIPQRVIDTWMGHTGDRSMGSVYYRLSDEDSRRFMKSVPF